MSKINAMGAHIALLTHAPNDLTVLHSALAQLPQDFPPVTGVDLQALESEAQMAALLARELAATQIIVLRVLGRLGSVPGFAELVGQARRRGRHLIAISGTGEPDPELAAVSTVSSDALQQALTYFQAGGSVNLAQLLRYLSDHLLLTGFGFEPALALPEHGLYHPDLSEGAGIDDWLAQRVPQRPSVGIVFYRAHWMSGNTRFVDALVDACAGRLDRLIGQVQVRRRPPPSRLAPSVDVRRRDCAAYIGLGAIDLEAVAHTPEGGHER